MNRFITSLLFFIPCSCLFAQTDFQKEAARLTEIISTRHVAPPTIDKQLSKKVVDLFLEAIDPSKIYFSEDDVNRLREHEAQMVDELKGLQWRFVPAITEVLKKNLENCNRFLDENRNVNVPTILKQPLELSYAPLTRPSNEIALQSRWKKMVLYSVYLKVMEQAGIDSIKASAVNDAYFLKLEPAIREKVIKAEQRKINNLLHHPEGFENHVASVFLNSYALSADPHSGYFGSAAMEKFMSSFLAEGFSFGIDLQEDKDGAVVLGRIVPGSQAWRSGQLNPGDKVMLITSGIKRLEIVGGDLQEAEDFLKDPSRETIELLVRKPNGTTRTVKLRKEKVALEENVVRSYVLNEEKKIGYIALPGFYSAPDEKTEGLRCANDVAKEIIKLKKENIEGLIFDLRNNGGGSLQEALSMAGIFIEEGPLGMIADKTGLPHIVKDNNRGTVYDGPLIILVNGFSASASEFLAAALQDYNRAVIVGSTTYGKATAQVILPLAPEEKNEKASSASFAKVTVNRIYRVTGKTAQERGVIPDIVMPDVIKALKLAEAYQPYHLRADSVNKKVFFTKLPPYPLADIKRKSVERMAKSEAFAKTENLVRWLAARGDEKVVISTWKDFVAASQSLDEKLKAFDDLRSDAKFKVTNTQQDQHVLSADHFLNEMNQHYLLELQTDYYLSECYSIMKDLIQQAK
ncbi:MAG: carboxy terminal-processing peptidase [Bacteroidetes bacterium]|nr:carboxy terminal-processing peptidase [Bacteroidota bacterium]